MVAPELSPELAAPVYHQEDYRYSYDPYERANRYAEFSRKLRANHIESRRSFILAQHKVIAAKSIDFEHAVQEMGVCDRLTYQLKQVIGQEYRDEDASSLYEGELEFALDKLLRYVALTGSPSPVDISYDVSFLFYCVGLGNPSALAHHVVTELLEQLYLQTPIWELHGHSLVDEKDWGAARAPPLNDPSTTAAMRPIQVAAESNRGIARSDPAHAVDRHASRVASML